MEAVRLNNDEYHDFLDDLTERRFFGEITFYFQDGNIESNRLIERNTKSEIREKMRGRKRRKVITVSRPSGGTANG
jgi:hypothetical protein